MPTTTHILCKPALLPAEDLTTVVLVGRRKHLSSTPLRAILDVPETTWSAMLASADPGDAGGSAATWVGARKVVVGVLPEVCSRHNSPSRAWAIPDLARKADGEGRQAVVLLVDAVAHAQAAALAVARAFPLYNRATSATRERELDLVVVAPDGEADLPRLQVLVDSLRQAAALVDRPTADLHTDRFVDEARALATELGVEIEVISGEALREQGFGGLWGVGRAATHLPALVALYWRPKNATGSVSWVGKGIVYDTGGLSLKTKDGMVGMKGDMGGAAAVFGAFRAAVLARVDYAITAVLCLAENAIGPDATRPDDVLVLKSGRSVEINNTDAEGRIVLADGVAWVAREHPSDLVVDIATLTGAALVATGKVHAAIVSNDAAVEAATIAAGLAVGEPCHPLPYAPELYRKEFKSKIADMKNSVKDRMNAQSSCAGQFVANHLPDPAPRWLHVDIAGPAWDGDNRGTGYGVGLLVTLGAGPPA